jgi:large subunit ribosomal protein L24
LSLAGNLDLTDGSIAARLVLSGSSQAAGARPDIFMALKGSVTAPSRSIDVSALTGWLTLRAVENQTKQLREIESASPQPGLPVSSPKSEQAPAPGHERRPAASVGPQN